MTDEIEILRNRIVELERKLQGKELALYVAATVNGQLITERDAALARVSVLEASPKGE